MSTGTKVPLAAALEVARRLNGRFVTACERLVLAGSLRRGEPHVGDIEAVAVPRRRACGLFGHESESILDGVLENHENAGLLRRIKGGEKYRQYELLLGADMGMKLDLFIARPENFGLILAIRTGPWHYSKRLVTPISYGGLLADDCRVGDGMLWCRGDARHTPDEESFFRYIKGGWVEPDKRR